MPSNYTSAEAVRMDIVSYPGPPTTLEIRFVDDLYRPFADRSSRPPGPGAAWTQLLLGSLAPG